MDVPLHDRAADYRRKAEQIRTIARQISLNEPRRQLLAAAEHLEVLAQEEERRVQAAGSSSGPKPEG